MSDASPTVVITGLGAITACGATLDETWQRVMAGESGIAPVEAFDTSRYRTHVAGEAHDLDLGGRDDRGAGRRGRAQQLSVCAAREAVEDAGLTDTTYVPERVAIVIGTSLGGMPEAEEYERARLCEGHRDGRLLYDLLPHAYLERLTATFGFRGPRIAFCTACTSSTCAIAYGYELLLAGRADAVLTGGVDPLSELSYAGFSSMGNVAPEPCSPFSEGVGLSLGEGAGMLVLELESAARRRGGVARARILGYGLSADAYHPTSGDPTVSQQARAARVAAAMASLAPAEIDYVNAHGTGTASNDPLETKVVKLVLGEAAEATPVSSVKGAVGHTLGAAGAVEAALTAVALERQEVPPTANFTRARLHCDLDYVPQRGRPADVSHALTLNFAFGGNNAALVLGRANGQAVRATPRAPSGRVVVTGLGVVSPIGCGVDELRAALHADACGIGQIERFDTSGLGSHLGAMVHDFPRPGLTRADLRRADRIAGLTVCGAELALRDADLTATGDTAEALGIVAGSTHGPLSSSRRFFEPIATGAPRANPSLFPRTVGNAGTGLAAAHLRLKGPNLAVCAGQASGVAAIEVAFDLIRRGAATAIVSGGVDELEPCILEGYAVTGRAAPHEVAGGEEVCAPFDSRRSGLVLGEGAAFLVLESLDSARGRGARIYAEVVGSGASGDAPAIRGADPSGNGMAACMRSALEGAGLEPEAIDVVGAGAMSHPLHDRIESVALRRIFGDRRPPVVALASRVGVSAATGPLTAAALALGMHEGFIPGGVARDNPDQECDVGLVEGPARRGAVEAALVNATALGGTNYSVALRRSDG